MTFNREGARPNHPAVDPRPRRRGDRVSGAAALMRRKWLATLFVTLALTGCAQGVGENRSYAPYSPENNGNMHDSGGGGGGGGGGGSM
jgi:hypothetical protein